MKCVAALALALTPIAAQPAMAQSDEARRFGAREDVQQISLSPEGKHVVAVMAGKERQTTAFVFAVDQSEQPVQLISSPGGTQNLDYCEWANNDRIVCQAHLIQNKGRDAIGFTRLFSVDRTGADMKELKARESDALDIVSQQDGGTVIDWLGDDADAGLLVARHFASLENEGGQLGLVTGYGVERVDPVALRHIIVEKPGLSAQEYITDGHGAIRVIGRRIKNPQGYDVTHRDYLYRMAGGREWLPLSRVSDDSQTASGFQPSAVDRDLNVVYGFDDKNGRKALYRVALDGSLKKDLVFARPDVDIDGLVQIGLQRRVVGATYATDRRQTEFFDPALKALQTALSHALPNFPLISFIDASADESRILLWVGSDVDPGFYAVYDKASHQLAKVLAARSELAGVKLAPVKSISFPAVDGTQIPAYLTLPTGSTGKNLPTIVMPHGGPSARDEWGFDWLAQFFAAHGYAVLQPNYRGSSGYGDGWFKDNGFKSWKTAIGDVDDGARWLVKQGIADPAKLAIVGWSYGGYAALQSQVLDPDLFKAVVAIAPITDLNALRNDHQDFTDFSLVEAFVGHGPHLIEGSPAQNVSRFKAPVLMFHGDVDQNVAVTQSRTMASRLKSAGKQVDYVEFKGLDHQLEDSDARTQMLDRADTFLRASLGIK